MAQVEICAYGGLTWETAEFIGLDEPYVWHANHAGEYTIELHDKDSRGGQQPETARWNCLGYNNNGVNEHAVRVMIA